MTTCLQLFLRELDLRVKFFLVLHGPFFIIFILFLLLKVITVIPFPPIYPSFTSKWMFYSYLHSLITPYKKSLNNHKIFSWSWDYIWKYVLCHLKFLKKWLPCMWQTSKWENLFSRRMWNPWYTVINIL